MNVLAVVGMNEIYGISNCFDTILKWNPSFKVKDCWASDKYFVGCRYTNLCNT